MTIQFVQKLEYNRTSVKMCDLKHVFMPCMVKICVFTYVCLWKKNAVRIKGT